MNVDGVEVHVEGQGAQAVVMIHGWPDTHRLWDAQVEALKPNFRCVRFTLPGFDLARPGRSTRSSPSCAGSSNAAARPSA